MARKRLSPAAALTDVPAPAPAPSGRPPIAQLAGDAAGRAELLEAAESHRRAREEGRLIVLLPLETIEPSHMVRDRLAVADADMDALKASIAARGQQTPIEVEDLGNGRYGLISGWRRLEALKALFAETGAAKFAAVQSLIRGFGEVADAYVAMVEENEIRASLSFYERARIAHEAAERGVFPTAEVAVRTLFRNASRPKRSKVLSFLRLYRSLQGALRFPAAISERLGLGIVKALDTIPHADLRFVTELNDSTSETAEEEVALLAAILESITRRGVAAPEPRDDDVGAPSRKMERRIAPQGMTLKATEGRLSLTGRGVDHILIADLEDWLMARHGALKTVSNQAE